MTTENKTYWLIAVPRPKGGEDTVNALNKAVTQDKELAQATYKFEIADLRVGNMDSLVTLSDDLKKVNNNVESTLKKIANQYFEIQREGQPKDTKRPDIEVRGSAYSVHSQAPGRRCAVFSLHSLHAGLSKPFS